MSTEDKIPATDTPADTRPAPSADARKLRSSRGRRLLLMVALPALLVAGGAYAWLSGGRYEETDNANLHLSRVTIASEIAGRVTVSNVADNARVAAGDVLFEVDPEPLKIALAQAEASIETARLTVVQLRAAYQQALAQAQVAANEVGYYKDSLDRQKTLSAKGVATTSAYDDARHAYQKAVDQHATAQQAVATARAALGTSVSGDIDMHPTVIAAKAARDKAAYNLSAATVRAPTDGIVYQASSFRPGQYVAAGEALFTLVETGKPWIEANFKETQLTHMAPEQPAEVVFDIFPDRRFKAKVESIGAGTGAEFSLLPAQNATGNWVKVTQRIPVRISLDNPDADFLMRSGMSASVTVDTGASRSLGDLFASARAAE
jgi:Multidrug resistance efflux pump